MIIDRVTITGADDSIHPDALLALSVEFPFVEWGILFSPKWQGSPRYPSENWLKQFDVTMTSDHLDEMRCSAHLCGFWVRDIMAGNRQWFDADFLHRRWFSEPLASRFQRVQLNFHGEPQAANISTFMRDVMPDASFIMQADGVNDATIRSCGCSPLFDQSGGAGEIPLFWPPAWPGIYCGYAGGLGPETLPAQLPLIAEAAGDATIWIDMERRVRSPDDLTFDLAKVRDVLAYMKEYIAR